MLEAKLRGRDNLQSERMRRFRPLVDEWLSSEEGQTLLSMLVDDFYQGSLHAPPVLPAEKTVPQSGQPRRRRRNRRPRNPAPRRLSPSTSLPVPVHLRHVSS